MSWWDTSVCCDDCDLVDNLTISFWGQAALRHEAERIIPSPAGRRLVLTSFAVRSPKMTKTSLNYVPIATHPCAPPVPFCLWCWPINSNVLRLSWAPYTVCREKNGISASATVTIVCRSQNFLDSITRHIRTSSTLTIHGAYKIRTGCDTRQQSCHASNTREKSAHPTPGKDWHDDKTAVDAFVPAPGLKIQNN